MLSHQALKVVADSVNPTLGALALALPFAKWRGQPRPALMHIGVTLLTTALMYAVRAAFDLEAVWGRWGMDFSTHASVCIILVVAVSSLNWRAVWIWGAVFVSYDALMVYQSYHTWVDIGTTSAVIVPFTLIIRYAGNCWATAVRRGKGVAV
jgi:hypothetical protein